MDFVNILGLIAGTLTTIAFLPQVIKTWQSKSTKDISFVMLITFGVGLFLWFIYGIYVRATPIILANLVTFILNLIIIAFKIRYKT